MHVPAKEYKKNKHLWVIGIINIVKIMNFLFHPV